MNYRYFLLENKRVEFGAKVNNIQIDGISFIERHSFEAFNEGVRVRQCIECQKELTGLEVKKFGDGQRGSLIAFLT